MEKVKNRVLISFDDICPYQCKHCYTLDIERKKQNRSIEEIVNSIEGEKFDVVYISQKRDNFTEPHYGIELCEKIYNRYKCHVLIITRNIFSKQCIEHLKSLNRKMRNSGKRLFVAVSIFATKSYELSENRRKVPSPYERIQFLEKIAQTGIYTMTLIRPVFPNNIVPIEELYEIANLCGKFNSCIVSSGLAVNDNILWRLGFKEEQFNYVKDVLYLNGAMEGELKFIDVSKELLALKQYCEKNNLMFFEHTMSAMNFYIEKE